METPGDERLLSPEKKQAIVNEWLEVSQPQLLTELVDMAAKAQLAKVGNCPDKDKIISLIKKAIMEYNQDPNPECAFDYYVPSVADQIIALTEGKGKRADMEEIEEILKNHTDAQYGVIWGGEREGIIKEILVLFGEK